LTDKKKIYDFYSSLKDLVFEDVEILLIVREIFNFIIEINFDDVNCEDSITEYNDETNCYEIALIGKNNLKCNLFFEISENNIINIHIGKGYGEYLFSQKIESLQDLHKLKYTLNDLFCNPIREKLIYCNDKLILSEYKVPYNLDGKISEYKFTSFLGSCWFWQMKWNKENEYKPWLEKTT
jgi:hypothetical protein